MGMTRGAITLFKFPYPTIAPQNSNFFLLFKEKSGFWHWIINSTCFFDFHTWECYFACPTTVLALRSPQHLIKCSKRCFVPHVLRWNGDPTAAIFPQILGEITPTQFRLLYKALGGFISLTFPIFELSRLPILPNFQDFPNLQTFEKLLKWPLSLFSQVFFVLRLFSPWPVSSAFYFLLLLHKYLLHFYLVYSDG